jgi:ribosomal-protein-alanine N-acetyltransferase
MRVTEITIGEATDDAKVNAFLDGQWEALDPEPWTNAKCVLTAERDGVIIGAATGRCEAGVAHLSALMVAAGERNNGLGGRLLAAFEAWAAARGAHQCTLKTRLDGPARRFYERYGWYVGHVLARHYQRRDWAYMFKEVAR